MLFRRIDQHVRNQNWFAVAIDFVIVVIGVFIGLQVNQWNESRQDRQMEAEYLERIDTELTRLLESDKGRVNWNETRIESTLYVVDVLSSGIEPDDENLFKAGLYFAGVINKPTLAWNVVEELQNTGRIALIRDTALRDALDDHEDRFEFRTDLIDRQLETIEAYRVEVLDSFEIVLLNSEDPEISNSFSNGFTINYDFDALASNDRLIDRLTRITVFHRFTHDQLEEHLEDVESLRDYIRDVRQNS